MMEMLKGAVTPRDWAISGGIVAAAIALCALFYFVPFTMQTKKLTEVQAQLKQKSDELAKAEALEKNIDKLRQESKLMDQLVSQFEMRLPENREIPTLLKQFEGFAGEIGLRVELSQLPRITDIKKETIPYSVKAWGNFHQIASFINRLERFQRYLKVSDLNIAKEEDGVAEASFTLSTYRFIQPSESSKS